MVSDEVDGSDLDFAENRQEVLVLEDSYQVSLPEILQTMTNNDCLEARPTAKDFDSWSLAPFRHRRYIARAVPT